MSWMPTESKDFLRSRSMKPHVGELLLTDFATGTLVGPLYEDRHARGVVDSFFFSWHS